MNITASSPDTSYATARSLTRPTHDRMLAGVAAGIADHFGVDVTIVRIVLLVLAVSGGAGIPLYLAGWLLIPAEEAEQSLAIEFLRSHPIRTTR